MKHVPQLFMGGQLLKLKFVFRGRFFLCVTIMSLNSTDLVEQLGLPTRTFELLHELPRVASWDNWETGSNFFIFQDAPWRYVFYYFVSDGDMDEYDSSYGKSLRAIFVLTVAIIFILQIIAVILLKCRKIGDCFEHPCDCHCSVNSGHAHAHVHGTDIADAYTLAINSVSDATKLNLERVDELEQQQCDQEIGENSGCSGKCTCYDICWDAATIKVFIGIIFLVIGILLIFSVFMTNYELYYGFYTISYYNLIDYYNAQLIEFTSNFVAFDVSRSHELSDVIAKTNETIFNNTWVHEYDKFCQTFKWAQYAFNFTINEFINVKNDLSNLLQSVSKVNDATIDESNNKMEDWQTIITIVNSIIYCILFACIMSRICITIKKSRELQHQIENDAQNSTNPKSRIEKCEKQINEINNKKRYVRAIDCLTFITFGLSTVLMCECSIILSLDTMMADLCSNTQGVTHQVINDSYTSDHESQARYLTHWIDYLFFECFDYYVNNTFDQTACYKYTKEVEMDSSVCILIDEFYAITKATDLIVTTVNGSVNKLNELTTSSVVCDVDLKLHHLNVTEIIVKYKTMMKNIFGNTLIFRDIIHETLEMLQCTNWGLNIFYLQTFIYTCSHAVDQLFYVFVFQLFQFIFVTILWCLLYYMDLYQPIIMRSNNFHLNGSGSVRRNHVAFQTRSPPSQVTQDTRVFSPTYSEMTEQTNSRSNSKDNTKKHGKGKNHLTHSSNAQIKEINQQLLGEDDMNN